MHSYFNKSMTSLTSKNSKERAALNKNKKA